MPFGTFRITDNFHNLRIPSGNESGANKYWIPGGFTSGKIIEGVMDFSKKVPFQEIKLKF